MENRQEDEEKLDTLVILLQKTLRNWLIIKLDGSTMEEIRCLCVQLVVEAKCKKEEGELREGEVKTKAEMKNKFLLFD